MSAVSRSIDNKEVLFADGTRIKYADLFKRENELELFSMILMRLIGFDPLKMPPCNRLTLPDKPIHKDSEIKVWQGRYGHGRVSRYVNGKRVIVSTHGLKMWKNQHKLATNKSMIPDLVRAKLVKKF